MLGDWGAGLWFKVDVFRDGSGLRIGVVVKGSSASFEKEVLMRISS